MFRREILTTAMKMIVGVVEIKIIFDVNVAPNVNNAKMIFSSILRR